MIADETTALTIKHSLFYFVLTQHKETLNMLGINSLADNFISETRLVHVQNILDKHRIYFRGILVGLFYFAEWDPLLFNFL